MLGLVLAGGGARGAFQAGAVQALLECGYDFDGVTGTSVGALNGVMVAQKEFERSIELWQSMEFSKLFDLEDDYIERFVHKKLDREALKYMYGKLRESIANRGVDTTKIRALLDEYIDENKVRRSNVDFGMVTFSLTDFKAYEMFKEDIPKGMLSEYVMASANFPGFKKLVIDQKTFVDGGIYDNLPVNMLAAKGYKDIIAVTTGGSGIVARQRKVKDATLNIKYINPSKKEGNTFSFDNNSVKRGLKIGYLDGMKMAKGLKGDEIYIDNLDYAAFEKRLLEMPRDFFEETCAALGAPCFESKTVNLVSIAGKIAKLAKLKKYDCIGEAFVAMCEEVALTCGFERLQIVDFDELIKRCVRLYLSRKYELKIKSFELYDVFLIFAKYFK